MTQPRNRRPQPPAEEDLTADPPGWADIPPADPDPAPPAQFPGSDREQLTGDDHAGRSIPASSLERLSRRGLQEAAEHGFRGIGDAFNAATAEDTEDTVWAVRRDEGRQFGRAAGRMLARRMPDAVGDHAPDASDLISVIVTLGVWAARGLAEWLPRGRDRWFPRAKGRHRRDTQIGTEESTVTAGGTLLAP